MRKKGIVNRKTISVLMHLLAWSVLLVGPFTMWVFDDGTDGRIRWWPAIAVVLAIGIFYLNYFLLIPKFLFQRKFVIYAATVLVLLALVETTDRLVKPKDNRPHGKEQVMKKRMGSLPARKLTLSALLLISFGIAVRMTDRWLQQDRLQQSIKAEQLVTELAFLKNQISPHFFFNTLNSIYALTESNPKKAGEVTYGLSKLMRYLIYESEANEMVTLGKEITFLKTYVELMRVRLAETVVIHFEHESEKDNCLIPPLLFIPFVENAFKHGVSLQGNSNIQLSLLRDKDYILFSSINTLPGKGAKSAVEEGGLGLANIKRRLELTYGKDQYHLSITETENVYDVQLKIPIQ